MMNLIKSKHTSAPPFFCCFAKEKKWYCFWQKNSFWGIQGNTTRQVRFEVSVLISLWRKLFFGLMIWTKFVSGPSDMPSIFLVRAFLRNGNFPVSYFNFRWKPMGCPKEESHMSVWTEQSTLFVTVISFADWISLWRFVEGWVIGPNNGLVNWHFWAPEWSDRVENCWDLVEVSWHVWVQSRSSAWLCS